MSILFANVFKMFLKEKYCIKLFISFLNGKQKNGGRHPISNILFGLIFLAVKSNFYIFSMQITCFHLVWFVLKKLCSTRESRFFHSARFFYSTGGANLIKALNNYLKRWSGRKIQKSSISICFLTTITESIKGTQKYNLFNRTMSHVDVIL